MKCLVQVNGKAVGGEVSMYLSAETIEVLKEKVVTIPAVLEAVGNRDIKHIVVVPDKLINVQARFKKMY